MLSYYQKQTPGILKPYHIYLINVILWCKLLKESVTFSADFQNNVKKNPANVMMNRTILIADVAHNQLPFLSQCLSDSGFFILNTDNYTVAERIVFDEEPDLLLIISDNDFYPAQLLITRIKKVNPWFPIVILSSIQNSQTKIRAFKAGVDDYILKPFHPEELVLRIRRFLKNKDFFSMIRQQHVTLGDVVFDITNGIVIKNKKTVYLRKKVHDFLTFLYTNRNQLISKSQLVRAVWNDDAVDDNVISVTAHEVRKVIEEDPANPRFLKTEKGIGYRLIV